MQTDAEKIDLLKKEVIRLRELTTDLKSALSQARIAEDWRRRWTHDYHYIETTVLLKMREMFPRYMFFLSKCEADRKEGRLDNPTIRKLPNYKKQEAKRAKNQGDQDGKQ